MANTAKRLQRLQTSILVTDTGLSSLQTLEQSREMPSLGTSFVIARGLLSSEE